uniref:Putative secreted protein n=1 Tax=Ixodes ricinus TaxID=34613 RepID=A0A6B0UMJ4_IXORI
MALCMSAFVCILLSDVGAAVLVIKATGLGPLGGEPVRGGFLVEVSAELSSEAVVPSNALRRRLSFWFMFSMNFFSCFTLRQRTPAVLLYLNASPRHARSRTFNGDAPILHFKSGLSFS